MSQKSGWQKFVDWFTMADYPQHTITPQNQAPVGGLVASAQRLKSETARQRDGKKSGAATSTAPWQEEAWELLDIIGEQRFLAHTLAGRMSQAALYVGKTTHKDAPGARPENSDDPVLQELLTSMGGGLSGQRQLVHRAGVNLFVAGEAWLIGMPPYRVPGTPEYEASKSTEVQVIDRTVEVEDSADDVKKYIWRILSVSEINLDISGDTVSLSLEDGETVTGKPSDFYLIRIWRSHPRRAWEADSPTRASLPVLRELLALTQHVAAQLESRLTGAGLLAVDGRLGSKLKQAAGLADSDPRDPLMEALTITMETSMKDRASASARVPLAVNTPDGVLPSEAFHHYTFATPLDKESQSYRDEAIRRLALGQDAPPELLLGTGGLNHWGAWLVREDVVKTHLEPPLALLCDALTKEFLRPLMRALGYSDEEIRNHVVWYDVDHLISRPNKTQDAKDAYNAGAISKQALRDALGFDESDAPPIDEVLERIPESERNNDVLPNTLNRTQ